MMPHTLSRPLPLNSTVKIGNVASGRLITIVFHADFNLLPFGPWEDAAISKPTCFSCHSLNANMGSGSRGVGLSLGCARLRLSFPAPQQ